MYIFLFIFVPIIVDGCSWLESIKDKRVKIELSGQGLHRKLLINTHLASLNRFTDCHILYEFTIPAGAYLDSDTVNASLPGHTVHSKHRFDVEAPMSRSQSHKVLILSPLQTRKSFIIAEKFELPFHVRYHSAIESPPLSASVQLTSPTVALDCPSDFNTFKLSSCKGKHLPSVSPKWILIEPLEKTIVSATIPVADRTQHYPILGVTAVTIFFGLCMIFTAKNPSMEV